MSAVGPRMRQWNVDGGDERMAVLASRVNHPDEREREYATKMLDTLWRIRDAAQRADAEPCIIDNPPAPPVTRRPWWRRHAARARLRWWRSTRP